MNVLLCNELVLTDLKQRKQIDTKIEYISHNMDGNRIRNGKVITDGMEDTVSHIKGLIIYFILYDIGVDGISELK